MIEQDYDYSWLLPENLKSIGPMTKEEKENQCKLVEDCPELPEWMDDFPFYV